MSLFTFLGKTDDLIYVYEKQIPSSFIWLWITWTAWVQLLYTIIVTKIWIIVYIFILVIYSMS